MSTELQIIERPAGSGAGRRLQDSLLALGGGLAGIALRPLSSGLSLGLRAERELRGALASRAEAAALATHDTLLATALATEALDRILRSELARDAIDRALRSELMREAIDQALTSELMREAVDAALAGPLAREAVDVALTGPLFEEAVERMLKTEALWRLVDEIAHSPSVAAAIQQQSVGFMDEVAGSVRTRTRHADDRLESRVRRAFGRKPRGQQPGEDATGA